jgi:O-antigen ligase
MLLTRTGRAARLLAAAGIAFVPLCAYAVFAAPPLVTLLAVAAAGLLVLRRVDWIGYATIIIALTRADAWLTLRTGLPFGTLLSLLIVAAALTVVLFSLRRLNAPNAASGLLFLFYTTAVLTSALAGNCSYGTAWLRDALGAFLTFGVVYCFVSDKNAFYATARVVVACGVALSLVNLAELLNPAQIQLSHSEGRAAGLLKNANVSAFVIVCCFVVFQMCRPVAGGAARWWTAPLQVLLMCGVLATFSRSGMLVLAGVVVVTAAIELRERRKPVALLVAAGAAAATALVAVRIVFDTSDVAVLHAIRKVSAFLSGEVDDNYRFFLVRYYFAKFLDQPLTGYGFYSTVYPSGANTDLRSIFGVLGPHNTPVGILVDFGLMAGAAYLLFLVGVSRGLRSIAENRPRAYLTLLFAVLCVYNVFIHNMYLSRPTMALFALVAAGASVFAARGTTGRSPARTAGDQRTNDSGETTPGDGRREKLP